MKKLFAFAVFLMLPFLLPADADDLFLTKERLFHVERSKNKNIVCYDVKINGSQLDTSDPINVYWVNREKKYGKKNGLSAIQGKLAFGYKIVSKGVRSAIIALNACPDREMKIEQKDEGFQCTIDINRQKAVLQKIYVKTKDSNSLKVEYVELVGINPDSGKILNEKIYN